MKSYEMVETLSNKAHVSLEQAKEALENSNWDILDAAIYIERHKAEFNAQRPQGAAPNPAYYVSGQQREVGGGYATPGFNRQGPFDPRTDFNRPHGINSPNASTYVPPYKNFPNGGSPYSGKAPNAGQPQYEQQPVGEFVGKLAGMLENLVNHIFKASFIVKRRGETIFTVPVLIFILALIAFFWVVVPVLVFGIAFECKYSLGIKSNDARTVGEVIDRTVNSALYTADKAKNTIMHETENLRAAYAQSKREFDADFQKGRDSVKIDLTKNDKPQG